MGQMGVGGGLQKLKTLERQRVRLMQPILLPTRGAQHAFFAHPYVVVVFGQSSYLYNDVTRKIGRAMVRRECGWRRVVS